MGFSSISLRDLHSFVIKLFVQQQEERKGRGAALCHL
jgi:hypothetical protein